MTTENISGSLTSEARLESNISVEHPFSHVIIIKVETKTGRVGVAKLVADFLTGCGRVDLITLVIKYQTTAEKQSIKFAVVESGSGISLDEACGMVNSFTHVSNSRNFGEQLLQTVHPDDTISRQIRPISADLPMMDLVWAKDDGVAMWITLNLKVRGIIKRYYTLK